MKIFFPCLLFFLLFGLSCAYSYDYEHFEYFRIPTDETFFLYVNVAQINDNGTIAFLNDFTLPTVAIWLWDNTNLSSYAYTPYITNFILNDNNDIAWRTFSPFPGDSRVYLNGIQLNLSLLSDMNDNQEIVYSRINDIYLWNGTNNTHLNMLSGKNVKINDNSDIAYLNPYNNNIYVWDGVTNQQITTNTTSDPDILYFAFNNLSQCTYINSSYELYFYDGSVTQLIASSFDSEYLDFALNDKGDVVWAGYDGNDSEIFLYSNGVVTQVTNNDYDDYHPDINNHGDIVYTDNGTSIIVATPVPEPSALALCIFGACLLKKLRK
ncbi:MAG: hypothetical protein RBU23_07245 [Candidatus Auribacterota bacterium]|jgi:hypothetical protein|nr:hypothetical protein [Candidatus Auribacterota bacterium]